MPLDKNVGLSDTDVMSENMAGRPGGPLFFPASDLTQSAATPSVPGNSPLRFALDRPRLQASTEAELQEVIMMLLARLEHRPLQEIATRPTYTDGTTAIDSMTAVWVIATVGKALGRRRLVRLSDVDRESLCSVGGVAKLIRRAIDTTSFAGAA